VSISNQRDYLKSQKERLDRHCPDEKAPYIAINDLGSGLNFKKRGLKKLIKMVLYGRQLNHLMESLLKIKLHLDDADVRVLIRSSKIINWLNKYPLEQANRPRTKYIASQDKNLGLTLYSKRGLRNLIPEIKKTHPILSSYTELL
jgi:hypothetical protein